MSIVGAAARAAGDDERALAARRHLGVARRQLAERAAHVLLVDLRQLAREARAPVRAERAARSASVAPTRSGAS